MNYMLFLDGLYFMGFLVIIFWILVYVSEMLNLDLSSNIMMSREEWYYMTGRVYK